MTVNKKLFNISWLVLVLWMGLAGLGVNAQTTVQSVYPAGAGIRVKEVDGSPNVVGVQTLVLPNGTLTRSGRTVTVSGGGGTTINSTNGQLPYRVNSTTFGDSAIASNALNSTYLSVTSGASGAGVTVAVLGGGTNENLSINTKGAGTIVSNSTQITLGPSAIYTVSSGIAQLGSSIIAASLSGFWTTNTVSGALSTGNRTYPITWASDTGLISSASGVLRVTNASTGAGRLLIGTSTDTVSAQLDVRSQNTTRPAGRFQAASTTLGSQEMLGVYDGSAANTFQVTAAGAVTMGDGLPLSNTPLWLNVGQGSNNPYILGYRVSSTDHLLLGATNASTLGVTSTAGILLSDKALAWNSINIWSASTPDLFVYRDAANTLAQRNGANAQTLRVYNTYTSGSNYERLGIQASSNAFFVTPEAATGTVRELVVGAAGSATRLRSSLATPSAPALADGDWWVECSGTSPARTCSILVRDTGATRTIATSVAF